MSSLWRSADIVFSCLGNLYYALTHPPTPLSDDEAYTLSWEAATKRMEAAGSIPVEEAELRAQALKANEAGIEVRQYLVDDAKIRCMV
jgi:hypothetical protein